MILIFAQHLVEEDVAVLPGDFEGAALVGVGAALAVFAVGPDRGAEGVGAGSGDDVRVDFVTAVADDRGDAVVAVDE